MKSYLGILAHEVLECVSEYRLDSHSENYSLIMEQ